jgi:16S rRNA A1518/A1519 N6-dimethyltransferase RsmA/KsgA/DIM1 with predicted DNA glycosylase/AP lyase activity
MVSELGKIFDRNPHLQIIHEDVLEIELPQFDFFISNIP